MRIENDGPHIGREHLVLFPFDDHSLPYPNGVEPKLYRHGVLWGFQGVGTRHPGRSGFVASHGRWLGIPGGAWDGTMIKAGSAVCAWPPVGMGALGKSRTGVVWSTGIADLHRGCVQVQAEPPLRNAPPDSPLAAVRWRPAVPRVAGRGRQMHLGIALWIGGNVMLGFHGMWNGQPSNDRWLVVVYLRSAVTNDGLHCREPIPDYPLVSAGAAGREVLLDTRIGDGQLSPIREQGFGNIGEETSFWYAP